MRETSLMLTFFTKDFGKIKGLMKGVRGVRAPHGSSCFELFALDEVVFYDRARSDIFTISQCDLKDYFFPLRNSLERLAYAAYFIELLDSVTALSDKSEEIFMLLLNSLEFLQKDASARRVARVFEIKLLGLLGIMPNLGACLLCGEKQLAVSRFSLRHGGMICGACSGQDTASYPILPGTVRFIEHVRDSSFQQVWRIKVSQRVGKDLESLLRRFLRFHIERRLKTLDFLRSIAAP